MSTHAGVGESRGVGGPNYKRILEVGGYAGTAEAAIVGDEAASANSYRRCSTPAPRHLGRHLSGRRRERLRHLAPPDQKRAREGYSAPLLNGAR